jgi:hypothetical protein
MFGLAESLSGHTKRPLSLVICGILVCFTSIEEANAEVCSDALVIDHLQSNSQYSRDYRFISSISESNWNSRKANFGAEALIGDLPIGGNYSDFRRRGNQRLGATSVADSVNISNSLIWSGLSDGAVEAYSNCLAKENKNNDSISLLPSKNNDLTSDNIIIQIRWNKGHFSPSRAQLDWSSSDPELSVVDLPSSIGAGESLSFRVSRPSSGVRNLVVNASAIDSSANRISIGSQHFLVYPPLDENRNFELSGQDVIEFPVTEGMRRHGVSFVGQANAYVSQAQGSIDVQAFGIFYENGIEKIENINCFARGNYGSAGISTDILCNQVVIDRKFAKMGFRINQNPRRFVHNPSMKIAVRY